MKLSKLLFVALSASFIQAQIISDDSAQIVLNANTNEKKYLIELTNGEKQWVTESEKWQLRGAGQSFMDITNFQSLGTHHRVLALKKNKFPKQAVLQSKITPLLKTLSKSNIQSHLEFFSNFHNRFYKSDFGTASSAWLFALINDTIYQSGADILGVTAKRFTHPWSQPSIIVTIPGQTNATIVVGAHQDSVNHADRIYGRAPGADDDGSGTMTILEVLRVLLGDEGLRGGKARNTLEFHWYAAEEGGMLGSQDVWESYEREGRDVKAMLQQDMTGFVELTVEAGKEVSFGIMMDFFDAELVEFTKMIIGEYTNITWTETICGRCGSDHIAAHKAGYPALFVFESKFEYSDNHVHGVEDLIKYLDFDHMIDHAQMTLGFVYELAFAKL